MKIGTIHDPKSITTGFSTELGLVTSLTSTNIATTTLPIARGVPYQQIRLSADAAGLVLPDSAFPTTECLVGQIVQIFNAGTHNIQINSGSVYRGPTISLPPGKDGFSIIFTTASGASYWDLNQRFVPSGIDQARYGELLLPQIPEGLGLSVTPYLTIGGNLAHNAATPETRPALRTYGSTEVIRSNGASNAKNTVLKLSKTAPIGSTFSAGVGGFISLFAGNAGNAEAPLGRMEWEWSDVTRTPTVNERSRITFGLFSSPEAGGATVYREIMRLDSVGLNTRPRATIFNNLTIGSNTSTSSELRLSSATGGFRRLSFEENAIESGYLDVAHTTGDISIWNNASNTQPAMAVRGSDGVVQVHAGLTVGGSAQTNRWTLRRMFSATFTVQPQTLAANTEVALPDLSIAGIYNTGAGATNVEYVMAWPSLPSAEAQWLSFRGYVPSSGVVRIFVRNNNSSAITISAALNCELRCFS